MLIKALVFIAFFCTLIGNEGKASPDIDVQGHRGARAVLPENSLAGFQYALEVGVDTIELDLAVSKDNVVVVVHDQLVNTELCQTQDGASIKQRILIHSLTLKEIKGLDCGSRPNLWFPSQATVAGSQIPTLAEVFELVQNSTLPGAKSIRFNIETKSNPSLPEAQPAPDEFVTLLVKVVDEYQLRSRVIIQSFDRRTLISAFNIAPNIPRAFLLREKPKDWLLAAQAAKSQIISPYFEEISRKDVKQMQNAGLKVIPWTVNSEYQWRNMIKLDVDGIITDDPLPLLKLLGRR